MAAVSLKQQKQGELIASETIEGVAKAIAENFSPDIEEVFTQMEVRHRQR